MLMRNPCCSRTRPRGARLLTGAILAAGLAVLLGTGAATAGPMTQARAAILEGYLKAAKAQDPAFAGFDAKRGEALFRTRHAGGKPETPACTVCHTDNPRKAGKTRANKPIEPLAVSRTPDRFTDRKKVEKWFRRNCRSVLGRTCTAREKGDFITFMMGQ